MTEVLNVKADPEEIQRLIDHDRYFPAYHMDKVHWISILLDKETDMDAAKRMLDESYARGEVRQEGPQESQEIRGGEIYDTGRAAEFQGDGAPDLPAWDKSDDFGLAVRRGMDAPEDGGVLAYGYVDTEGGFTFEILAPAKVEGTRSFLFREFRI